MGSIPLPALQVQSGGQDPLEQYGKYVSLQNLLQGRQLQQEQLKGARLDNQLREQSIQDQKASTEAMQSWDGKDLEQLPGLILKHGGSANAVFGAKQQILAHKEKLSQIAKDDATTGATNLDTMAKKNDALLGKLQGVSDGPGLLTAAQQAAQEGLLDPQHLQAAQQIAQLPPDQLEQTLSGFKKSLMGQKEQFA